MREDLNGFERQVADQSEGWIKQFIKSDQSGFLRSSGGRKKTNKTIASLQAVPSPSRASPSRASPSRAHFYGLPRRLPIWRPETRANLAI